MANLNKACYIQSIEASEIHSYLHRERKLETEYVGCIPYSLELIKLISVGVKPKAPNKYSTKEITDDLINVKFKQSVSSGNELINKILPNKIEETKNKIATMEAEINENTPEKERSKITESISNSEEYIEKLKLQIEVMELEMKDENFKGKWDSVSNNKLREDLYNNGFSIRTINKKTGEFKDTHYVVYKRSSSKSRKGECLFINEKYYKKMIKWSRMGLSLKEDMDIDLASLAAYQSLVGSSLQGLKTIPTENILIVEDVESVFKEWCNVVRKGEDGFLDSFYENATIRNSLFDGSSLLDSSYFEEGVSMLLLRQHMFKSASFSTRLQDYYKAQAKVLGEDYDTWTVKNMFGEDMLVKSIHMVITPNSLKALKFAHLMNGKKNQEKKMWNYWKQLLSDEGSQFGVCKHEKESKLEDNLQVSSYQMWNSLPMTRDDVNKLTRYELQYIHNLKENDDFFIEHIKKTDNDVNSNMMWVDIYNVNKEIVRTKIFRDLRKSEIHDYVKRVKKGKVKLESDYVVLLGNPMLYLRHSIGQLDVNGGVLNPKTELELVGNQVHTTLHPNGIELVGFRNPHTSPSNVLVAKNTYAEDINTYFNLSKNIVCINAVSHNVLNKLSGADFDSDSCLMVSNDDLLRLGKACQKYPVDINDVECEKKPYKLNTIDMCKIDNTLSESQKFIGKTVNTGQFALSCYWDQLANRVSEDDLKGLMKKISIATVLSGIAIDLAKKLYDIDPMKEIRNIESYAKQYIRRVEHTYINKKGKVKKTLLQKLPQFWVVINKSETIGERVTSYDCPMDYLFEVMGNLDSATPRMNLEFTNLLVTKNLKKGDYGQELKMKTAVEKVCSDIRGIYASSKTEEEKNEIVVEKIKYCNAKIGKLNVKSATMYSILKHMINNKCKNATKLMNTLYTTQPDVFLEAFKRDT